MGKRFDDAFLKATYGSRAKYLACLRGCLKARSEEKYEKYERVTRKLGMEVMSRKTWLAHQKKAVAQLRESIRVNTSLKEAA